MPPTGIIARAVADYAVSGQPVAHRRDAWAEVQGHATAGGGGGPCEVIGVGVRTAGTGRAVDSKYGVGEFRHARADREIGPIGAVEFVRVGMDVDKPLLGMLRRHQRVAVRGRFAEPRPDHEQQVGMLDSLDESGIRTVAEVAAPDRAVVRHRVLAAECGCHGDAATRRPIGKVARGVVAPARAADNRDRTLGAGRSRRPISS